MADGDLASIISGTDPTAAAQLQALQGQNIAGAASNPLYWQNQGIFGGLARQMALGQGMDMARGGVNSAVSQNLAAQPDLAAAMASPNPMGYPAANPNMDAVARARLIQAYGGPGARLQTGEAEQAAAAAGLSTAETTQRQIQNARGLFALKQLGILPGGGGAAAPATGTGAPAIGSGTSLPPASSTPFGSGRYPAPADQAAPAPDQATPATTPTVVPGLGAIPPPGPARRAWYVALPPQQKVIVNRLYGGGGG